MKLLMHRRSPVRLFWKSLRHDFDWRGRASIAEFWNFNLFSIALIVGAGYLGNWVEGMMGWEWRGQGEGEVNTEAAFVLAVCGLLLPPYISVAIRRLHDSGRSGWTALILLIPYGGALWMFIYSLIPGLKYETKFGIEPRYDYP